MKICVKVIIGFGRGNRWSLIATTPTAIVLFHQTFLNLVLLNLKKNSKFCWGKYILLTVLSTSKFEN